MQRFTINADKFDEMDINKEELKNLIDKHKTYVERITKNIDYYEAKHEILKREKKISSASNVKTVCNHAKDIVDTAKGYFMSTPISFSTYDEKDKESIQKLIEAFDMADIDDIDSDNTHDMGVVGVAYEYVYVKSGTTELTSKNIEPDHTFLVYDDTIEQNLLFGVYYFKFKDAITENECYRATVCTKNLIHQFILECSQEGTHKEVREAYKHFLGNVPIIEFLNNKNGIGDFEQQISLIDAYNTLMSDRVNDKVQFVESSPKWENGIQITKLSQRKWLKHGKLPWVEYTVSNPIPTPPSNPTVKDAWGADLQRELNKQYNVGLAVDGIVGPKTKSACPTVKRGAKGGITKLIQKRLNSVGFHIGVDGDFGTNTYNAIKVFQKNRGLNQDGIVGPNTWSYLLSGKKY